MKCNIETGIDHFAPIIGKDTDSDYFNMNSGVGKLYTWGPTCHFRGKGFVGLVEWPTKVGITSEILADALKHID